MSHEKNLRQSLFEVEPVSAERRHRFHEELAHILEPPLPRAHRLYYIAAFTGSLFGILGTAFGLAFDAEHRWMHALFLLIWTLSAAWVLHILRRGAEPMRMMQSMSKALTGISVAAATAIIVYGLRTPSPTSTLWALFGLLMFLLMSFINLWNRVILAERTTREHILRVEYRLADLASLLPPAIKP